MPFPGRRARRCLPSGSSRAPGQPGARPGQRRPEPLSGESSVCDRLSWSVSQEASRLLGSSIRVRGGGLLCGGASRPCRPPGASCERLPVHRPGGRASRARRPGSFVTSVLCCFLSSGGPGRAHRHRPSLGIAAAPAAEDVAQSSMDAAPRSTVRPLTDGCGSVRSVWGRSVWGRSVWGAGGPEPRAPPLRDAAAPQLRGVGGSTQTPVRGVSPEGWG